MALETQQVNKKEKRKIKKTMHQYLFSTILAARTKAFYEK